MRALDLRLAILAAAATLAAPPVQTRRVLTGLPDLSNVDPVARLTAFQRQRPHPWRTASRFSNRHIRRQKALADGRRSDAADMRRRQKRLAKAFA